MMIMATGTVTARTDDGNVVATFQSGRDTIEIILSFHQACRLGNAVLQEAVETLDYSRQSADVIPFGQRARKVRKPA